MSHIARIPPVYSRAERLSDGAVHFLGVGLALLAVPILIWLTVAWRDEPAAILGVTIYGITLMLMLTFSALYNMIDHPSWSGVLKRLDHSGIYLKIAGTYTPFVLLSGAHMPVLLGGLWGSATLGSLLKVIAPGRFRWFSIALYLAMGWAGVWAGGAMLAELPSTIRVLMIAGGITYTAGVVFYLLQRMPFHNTIWHVFVLAGSVLFFIAITLRVADIPAATI